MNRIKELRKSLGMTQEDVAKKLNTTKVSLGRYEKNDDMVSITLLKKLAVIFNTTISDVAGVGAVEEKKDFNENILCAAIKASMAFYRWHKENFEKSELDDSWVASMAIHSYHEAMEQQKKRKTAINDNDVYTIVSGLYILGKDKKGAEK